MDSSKSYTEVKAVTRLLPFVQRIGLIQKTSDLCILPNAYFSRFVAPKRFKSTRSGTPGQFEISRKMVRNRPK